MKIKKIKSEGLYIYPATIAAAVKDANFLKEDDSPMTLGEINLYLNAKFNDFYNKEDLDNLLEATDDEDDGDTAEMDICNSVLFKVPLTLSDEEKQNVRANIGAASNESVLNKVDKNATIANDGNYIFALDANNNPIRIAKSDMVSIMADAIKANAAELAKVTFGATTAAEMASVVAGKFDDNGLWRFTASSLRQSSTNVIDDYSAYPSGVYDYNNANDPVGLYAPKETAGDILWMNIGVNISIAFAYYPSSSIYMKVGTERGGVWTKLV